MSRNLVQEIHSYSRSNYNRNKQKSLLLDETMPKYRNQIFERNLSIVSSREKNSSTTAVKERYKNFGQQEFIRKLKHNSTKQIDKKSIKAIDRYLKQLSQQKFQPMGYLGSGNSMGWNFINQRNLIENKQNTQSQHEFHHLTKNYSQPLIPTKSFKPTNVINIKQQQPQSSQSNRNYNQLKTSSAAKSTVRQSANFQDLENEEKIVKNNCVQSSSSRNNSINHIEAMSFRKNGGNDERQLERQERFEKMAEEIEKKLYSQDGEEKGQNQDQHQNYQNQVVILSSTTPKQHFEKLKNYQQLKINYEALLQKNLEQEEIINLQQMMIEKLNVQLKNLTQMIKEVSAKQKVKKEEVKPSIITVNHQSQHLLKKIQQTQVFNKELCQNAKQIMITRIQSFDQEWKYNYEKLKKILVDVEESINPQSQIMDYQDSRVQNAIFFSFDGSNQVSDSHSGNKKQSLELSQNRSDLFYPPIYQSPEQKNKRSSQVGMSQRSQGKDRRQLQLSNFNSSERRSAEIQLEYSAGTEINSP